MALTGCKDDIFSSVTEGDGEIKAGEQVMFTTYVPLRSVTRAETQEEFNARMASYKAVSENCTFSVEMYEQPTAPSTDPVLLGNGVYAATPTVTVEGNTTVTTPADGTLTPTTPLYWPGNEKRYGFRATAGSETMEGVLPSTDGATIKVVDQTTKEKLLFYDRLEGYGFEPLWDTGNGTPRYNEGELNYLTAREWYQANRTYSMAPGYTEATEWYKKVPLYLQHRRSLITIRLKAGEGVERSVLAYGQAVGDENVEGQVSTAIYSYADGTQQEIQPLAKEATVDYSDADDGGAATDVPTTAYTCIVEPHNYLAGATTEPIARINLSGQHFTFYASNDFLYKDSQAADATGHDDAVAHMEGYDLQAGQHLVITVTLGRDSRKILITAYVEDWDETVTTSIVDDYGQTGDPIQITTRDQLYEFLTGPNNKAGNVAIIVPNSLNLEKSGDAALAWNYNSDSDTSNDLVLHATLNLAGATLRTDHPILKEIRPTGNIVNGTITVGTDRTVETPVTSAISDVNYGSIDHVTVLAKDASGNDSKGYATCAGMVRSNSGIISGCTSELRVYGSSGVVGGIAAESVYSAVNGNTMPVIDGCTVNARVDGVTRVGTTDPVITVGGGIVGKAVGRVTNNTFSYGRTVLQHQSDFQNIIYAKADDSTHALRASGNAWPTDADNFNETDIARGYNENGVPVTNTNTSSVKYTGVIDSQKELAALVSPDYGYNKSVNSFRLSDDFTVSKSSWTYGGRQDITNETGAGNLLFRLDGNNHVITTDAMLFSNISGSVNDLVIKLSGDLIATPTKNTSDEYDGREIIAPLAYSVFGSNGKISNVQVKGGDYRIQAATVGGIVVWAYGGATIENCQCKANIQLWVNATGDTSEDAKKYAGGIVAEAANATITRCIFHNTGGTLSRNKTADPSTVGEGGTSEDMSPGLYYGGILGGTAEWGISGSSETPNVTITDCSSWFGTSENEHKGAIVGYAVYRTTSSKPVNGLASDCQGNWWNTSARAIGTVEEGMTVEEVLGKKNAVAPTADTSF